MHAIAVQRIERKLDEILKHVRDHNSYALEATLKDLAALLDGDGGQRQDNDPDLHVTVARMREAIQRLRANLREALNDLVGMVTNACTVGDVLTSHRSDTNAGALHTLAKHGYIRIIADGGGRMVTARWVWSCES